MIDVLRRIPVEWITSPELTGDMEASLLSVQRGETPMQTYMDKIIQQTQTMVERIRDHDRNTLYLEEERLVPARPVAGTSWKTRWPTSANTTKGRNEGCKFVFSKDTSGRWFDRTTASRLIEQGSLENLHGFYSQAGEGYETSVELKKDGKVMSKGSGSGEASENDEVSVSCPVCDHGSIRITKPLICAIILECTFRGMQNVMCKRVIPQEEAKPSSQRASLRSLKTSSRRNKPFNAYRA